MPTELLAADTDGFVDLRFAAELLPPVRPGTCRARLVASHEGHDVGFVVEVATDLVPGLRGAEVVRSAFRREAVVFRSDGERTDRLVAALARVTGVAPLGLPTRETLTFTVFPLQEEPVDPLQTACKLKLFHDDTCEHGEYAEAYLNLHLSDRWVGLNEKDPEYRPYWVRAWSVPRTPWSRITLARDPGSTLAHVGVEDLRRALDAVARGEARRVVMSGGEGGESLIVAATPGGVGLLASLPPTEGPLLWRRSIRSSEEAERLTLAWAADGTVAGEGWETMSWEQASPVFG